MVKTASNVAGFGYLSVVVGNHSLSMSRVCPPLCWFHFQAGHPQTVTKFVPSGSQLRWLA